MFIIAIILIVINIIAKNSKDKLPCQGVECQEEIVNETVSNITAPSSISEKEILIGIEYVVEGLGEGFKDLGIPCVKPLPGSFSWDKMQKNPNAPIDFSFTDKYVKEFQNNGFTCLILGLKVNNNLLSDPWMVDDQYPKSQAINPKYHAHFSNWVRSLAERYDKDGTDDMPGLKHSIFHYEIGVEFSSYQPEPTDIYLKSLELAYKAAHEASDKILIAHSAFLVTGPFSVDPKPGEYESAFTKHNIGTDGKNLSDIRKILDRPNLFDVINLHNLGWPYEIESMVRWIDHETSRRNYSKPIIISDTVPTSFAGMGPATVCTGKKSAFIMPPAKETDRCRLADYFKKLINKDEQHISWLRKYLAADTVQRVVIAAEQGIELIDIAFTGDLPGATTAFFQAGAGNSGWGGIAEIETHIFSKPKIKAKRPAFFALQQLEKNIRGYNSIARMATENDLRLYQLKKDGKTFYIAWYGYQNLYLPDDPLPQKDFQIKIGGDEITVEQMKTSDKIFKETVKTKNGILNLKLTPEPIYLFPN